jgi:hypothetical protein
MMNDAVISTDRPRFELARIARIEARLAELAVISRQVVASRHRYTARGFEAWNVPSATPISTSGLSRKPLRRSPIYSPGSGERDQDKKGASLPFFLLRAPREARRLTKTIAEYI